MKTTAMRNHLLTATVILVTTTVCHAEEGQFYLGADLGVATVSDVKLRNISNNAKYRADIETGPRLSLNGGYEFYQWFAAGAELSVIQSGGSSDYWQAPLIGNFEFRLPNKSRFTPFVGGGPGAAYRNFSRGDGGQDRGHLAEITFAWQVNAGLRYAISDRCSVGLIYRYLDLPSSGESKFEWNSDMGEPTRVEGTRTQSISLGFGWKF